MTCEWCNKEAMPPTRLCLDHLVSVRTEEILIQLETHLVRFAENFCAAHRLTLQTAEQRQTLDAALFNEAVHYARTRGGGLAKPSMVN